MENDYKKKEEKLNANLNAIGNCKSTDEMVNQIKGLHAQLQDMAHQNRLLQDRVDEKNGEIQFLNEQLQVCNFGYFWM